MVLVEPLICWESLFAGEVHATASDEPSVIALLVNDAWFGPTSQPELHNLVSAFRAAEAGRPLVIASNTGPSWIIDAHDAVPSLGRLDVPMLAVVADLRRFGQRSVSAAEARGLTRAQAVAAAVPHRREDHAAEEEKEQWEEHSSPHQLRQ